MNRLPLTFRLLLTAGSCLNLALPAAADLRVAVVAKASPEYTARKFAGAKPLVETYVFMQGGYFDGQTVDRSIERMPFRKIAEFLAPELARQNYLPTTDPHAADLLIVVHWGTTRPYNSSQEMTGRTSVTTDISTSFETLNHDIRLQNAENGPGTEDDDKITQGMLSLITPQESQLGMDRLEQFTDQLSSEMTRANNVKLLGYNNDLYRYRKNLWPTEAERSARYELADERYFIILMAYDLRSRARTEASRRALWTMHLNMASPGTNFSGALTRMSTVAVDFVGRTTLDVARVRPGERSTNVKLAPLTIIGEVREVPDRPTPPADRK